VIASDHDGDGQPDPNSVIDVCSVGATGIGSPDAGTASVSPKAAAASTSKSTAADAGVAAVAVQTDSGPAKTGTGAAKKEIK
jgi:hypothetical protein